MLKHLVLSGVILVLVFSGCGAAPSAPKAVPGPKTPPASKTDSAVKPDAAPVKPAEPAKPVELVPAGPNLLNNPSFENWAADGKLAVWNLAEGKDTWTPITGKKVAGEAQSGSFAIELPPPSGDKHVVLAQTVLPDKIIPERRFALSAKVSAPEKESVLMMLTYKANQKTESIRRLSQGGAGWEKLSTEFLVPKEADTASFRIQFIVHQGLTSPVQIDDVRMQVVGPKGSAAAKQAAPAASVSAPTPASGSGGPLPSPVAPAVTPLPAPESTPVGGSGGPLPSPVAPAVTPLPSPVAPAAASEPTTAPEAEPVPAPAKADVKSDKPEKKSKTKSGAKNRAPKPSEKKDPPTN